MVYLDNLVPQIRQHRQSQIAMGNGGMERTIGTCLLGIDMNPLMIKSSISKKIDTLLRQFYIITHTQLLTQMGSEFFIRANN